MARWTDLATWVGAGENFGDGDYVSGEASDRMYEVRGVILHIAEGSYAGTVAWQNNPGSDVSSHFTAAKDGRLAQGVDTDDTAWTQGAGNGRWISVENEGFHTEAPTWQQVESNAQILARAHVECGVPLQMTDDPNGRGLGWHGMGGAAWGGHYGCPGEGFKAARGAIIARATEIVSGDDMTPEQAAQAADTHYTVTNLDYRGHHGAMHAVFPLLGDDIAAVLAAVTAMKTTLAALLSTGANADTAAILTKMQQLADADRARDEAYAAELRQLRAALAAAEQAAADKLKQ